MIIFPHFTRRRFLRRTEGAGRGFRTLHVLRFFLSLGIALPVYINSTYLATYSGEQAVGFLYSASSILAAAAFFFMPKILSSFGNYALAFLMIFFLALASFELATLSAPIVIFLLFIAYKTITSTISFPMDAFIEKYSADSETGKIRGSFLALSSLAFLIAPLLIGVILENGEYWKIYLLSTVFLLFSLLILFFGLRDYRDPDYDRVPARETVRRFLANQKIRTIFGASILLRSFIAFVIVYFPLFLHEHVGFAWSEISIILVVMLLPSILLTVPVGNLADKRFGEKELLLAGFVIAGTAVMMIPFLESNFVAFLLTALVAMIGVTLVEITSESYFFKHVDETDADLIGFFRNARPIAYFVVPLAASFLLIIMPLAYVFSVFGAVLIVIGVPIGLHLRDTR